VDTRTVRFVTTPGTGLRRRRPAGVKIRRDVNLQQKAEVLARTELFGGVDEAARRLIAERVAERIVERGRSVFVQDEPGDRMYVLAEGAVKLYVSSRDGGIVELARHRPPAVFGELALLDGGSRSASAEAVERSTLLVVTRVELLRLLRSEDKVAEALLRLLGAIVRRTTRQVTDLVFLNLRGRVARQLLLLAEDGNGSGAVTRQVTQGELATMVGGARQTVNQVLRSLEARGFIRATGGAFEVLDRDQLQRLAE
jgi:CRP/FNR family transcriptional regulator, cyclic AMP receptor protein